VVKQKTQHMAFAVKIYGTYLDLLPDAQLSFEKNTELWTTGDPTVQVGSYSFPFDLPLTETNRYLLRFPERIDAYTTPQEIGDAVIYIGEGLSIGLPVFTGKLYVKQPSNKSVSVFIVVNGLGNKKELKISEVDMGVFNLGVPVDLKAVMDYAADNPLDGDFVFFPVQNKSLYYALSEVDPETDLEDYTYYNETINRYMATGADDWWWNHVTNTKWVGNLMIVPFLRLEFALQKVVQGLGYTIVNDWLTTDELKSICIFNNKSINDVEFRYKEIIRYNEHLPSSMTLVEFLKGVCKYGFVGVFVDHFSKTITLKPYKDVLKAVPRHDWTDRQTEDYEIEQDNKVPYAIGFEPDPSDAYFNKKYVTDLVLELDGAIVTDYWKAGGDFNTHGLIDGFYLAKRNNARYRYDPSRSNPFEKFRKGVHKFKDITIGGNGDPWLSKVSPLFDDDVEESISNINPLVTPRCEIPMDILIKENDQVEEFNNELTSVRLTIYRGWKEFPGKTNAIPWANSSAYDPDTEEESYELSLHLDGDKGIYKKYGQEWIHFMKNKKVVKRNLALTVADILNHKEYDKVRIGNMNYFVKSMRITVTATGLGLTECELVTIPIS
jgi:hypothetical protein